MLFLQTSLNKNHKLEVFHFFIATQVKSVSKVGSVQLIFGEDQRVGFLGRESLQLLLGEGTIYFFVLEEEQVLQPDSGKGRASIFVLEEDQVLHPVLGEGSIYIFILEQLNPELPLASKRRTHGVITSLLSNVLEQDIIDKRQIDKILQNTTCLEGAIQPLIPQVLI